MKFGRREDNLVSNSLNALKSPRNASFSYGVEKVQNFPNVIDTKDL